MTFLFSPLAVPRSIAGCFTQQNIEVVTLHCLSAMNRGLLLNSSLAVSRSITGCFDLQNIGEVAARTEGLENTGNGSDRIKPYKSKILCPLSTPPHTANAAQRKRVKTRQ